MLPNFFKFALNNISIDHFHNKFLSSNKFTFFLYFDFDLFKIFIFIFKNFQNMK